MRVFILVLGLLACAREARSADEPVWISTGSSVTNSSYPLVKSTAWAAAQDLEYSYGKLRLGYLNEGHKVDGVRHLTNKRDGVYAQWLGTHWLTAQLATELSLGAYISATTVGQPGYSYKDVYRLNGLIGIGLRYRCNALNVMLMWQRALWTKVDGRYADADIFGLWIGFF
jgi:hypothetical protein